MSLNKKMDVLFNPQSVAVVGASTAPFKPSAQPVFSMKTNRFNGRVYPVNPRYNEINGLPCYPSLESIPGEVDLAIIGVPVANVKDVLMECVGKKVKGVVVLTSGFSEVGDEGANMQKEIARIVRENGMVMCGPNSQGIFNSLNGLTAGFAIGLLFNPDDVIDSYGFVSQSGGIGTAVYMTAQETCIGFTYFISSGNEADLEFSDYVTYMVNDPSTKVIGGYLEGVKDGGKLIAAADQAIQAQKPLVMIKAGRNPAAARAASSHTGSMVGSEAVYQMFFHQKAIIRAEGVEELNTILSLLVKKKLPEGNRVAVVASSGGNGVLISDKCASAGMDVVSLSPKTRKILDEILPTYGSSANPIDLTSQIIAEPDLSTRSIQAVLDDPNVDMVVIEQWPGIGGDMSGLDCIIKLQDGSDKPIMVTMLGSEKMGQQDFMYLRRHHVPVARSQEMAVRALGAVAQYSVRLKKIRTAQSTVTNLVPPDRSKVEQILTQASPGTPLTETQSKQIFGAYGIPVTNEKAAQNRDDAVIIAEQIGYPVVLKVDSADIQHKTEVDGIRLNLKTPEEVATAFDEIMEKAKHHKPEARLDGVLLQEMVSEGIECIVGLTHDQTFGPTVMFGLGGVFVEALEDFSLRICPVSPLDADEMITEIKAQRVLSGFRGKPPVDREAISDVILKVAQLATDFPQIREMDINPLMVFSQGNGVRVADALIVTGES